MSDRDDLAALIDAHGDAPYFLTDEILRAGWRRSTVTPEQVESAAQAMHAAEAKREFDIAQAHYDHGNRSEPPISVETWNEANQEDRDDYRRYARVAIESIGLSVAEDGEQ